MATYAFVRAPLLTADPSTGQFPISDADGNFTPTDKVNIPLSGFGAPVAAVPMGSQQITGLADGTAADHAVNYGQLLLAAQGIGVKQADYSSAGTDLPAGAFSSNVITGTANGALANQDGQAVALNDLLLVLPGDLDNITGISPNNAGAGIYKVTRVGDVGNTYELTRDVSMNASAEVPGTMAIIQRGTLYANYRWWCTNDRNAFTLNTTAVTGVLEAVSDVVGGTGLTQSISAGVLTLAVNPDGTTIETNADIFRVKADGIANSHIRDSVALSVIGRSANSVGDPADIAASPASGAVLRESGSVLGFGQVATAGLADGAVDNAKLADMAALTVKVRAVNSSGDPSDLAIDADFKLVQRIGSALVSGYHRLRQGTAAPPAAGADDVGGHYYRVSASGGGIGAYGRLYFGVQTGA